jgi:hypothetical protein
MAEQFDQPRTVIQPQATEQPAALSGVFDRQAAFLSSLSSTYYGQAQQQIGQASAYFDKALEVYGREAEQKAVADAPAMIKYDGNHNLIPPSSFYPPGISTRAYSESFKTTAEALYRNSAENELIQHSNEMRVKFAADPAAYSAAMAAKSEAMRVNLDPKVAPWLDLRSQQITSQGISVLAVQNQTVQNAITKEAADRTLAGVRDDAGRLVAAQPSSQGGGGTSAGYDNNIGNITVSGDQYHGGKGLPIKVAGNPLTFETFQSAEQGVAASYNLIRAKAKAEGGQISFATLVDKWDPNATPEVKANYAGAMAKAAGLASNDNVPLDDTAKMAEVLKAQNRFEKGKVTVPDSAFADGVRFAQGDKTVSPKTNIAGDVALADPKALADRATLAINSAELSERLKRYEVEAKAAGISPAEIERNKNELRYDVQIKAMTEQIKSSAPSLYGRDGYLNQGAVAATEESIRQTAAKYPGREKQVTEALQGALAYAQTQASRQANQIQVNDQRTAEPKMRQMAIDAANAKAASLAGDSLGAAYITNKLEQQGRDHLNDTSLSDSVAMKLGSAAFQNGAVSRGALQESYTNRLQGLSAIVNSPSSSPDQVERARSELLTINSDPAITRDLTAGQRAYAQSALDKVVTTRLAGDYAGMAMQAPKGEVTPAVFDQTINDNVKKGVFGDTPGAVASLAQAAQLSAVNRAAWDKNMANDRLATDGLDATLKGRPVTDAQREAIKQRVPFRLPGEAEGPDASNPGGPAEPIEGQTYNPANPAHVQRLSDYLRRTGVMPDRVKDSTEHMPRSPNEQDMAKWANTYSAVAQVVAEKQQAVTGLRPKVNEVQTAVGALIGESTATYLANVQRYGAEAAFRMDQANASKTSVTGATGQPNNQLTGEVDSAADKFTKEIVDSAGGSSWYAKLGALRIPFTDSWKLTEKERAAEALFSVSPDARPGFLGRVTGGPAGQNYSGGIKFSEDAKDFIAGQSAAYLATDGHAINGQITNERPADYAFRAMAEKNKDMLELVSTGDGTTAEIRLKSFSKATAEKMGMDKLTPEATQGMLDALVQSDRRARNLIGTTYDPKTLIATPVLESDNSASWTVTARDKTTGMPVTLLDLSQNDPRLKAEAVAADRQAWLAVDRYWQSEDGKKPAPGTVAAYGSSLLRTVLAPMDQWLHDRGVSPASMNAQDNAAFQTEFNRRLQQLPGSQADWKATLDKIAKDPTPDDGRHGVIRSLVRAAQGAPAEGAVPAQSPVVLPAQTPIGTGPDAAAEAAARAAAESAPNRRGR